MALEGTLRDFSLSDIFQLIGLQRKTGVLTLKGKDDTVHITFLDGKVVNAESEKRKVDDRLGTVLLKRGSISKEKLEEVLKIQKETLQRLGYVLVHYGFIDREELREALQQQILQIIYRVFRWRDGEYHFSQETTVEYDRDSITPVTAETILMEGAQMLDEWPIIERRISSPSLVFEKKKIDLPIQVEEAEEDTYDFEFSEEPGETPQEEEQDVIKLTPLTHHVYQLVDGKRTVNDIVEISRYREFDTYKALYELASRNLIEEKKVEEKPPQLDQEEEVLPAPKEGFPFPFGLTLIGVLFLSLGILFAPFNPFKDWQSLGKGKINLEDEWNFHISMERVTNLQKDMYVFSLIEAHYPEDIQQMLTYGLGKPSFFQDPWKRSYLYLHKDATYYLIGFEPSGDQSVELISSHPEITGVTSQGPLESPAPKIIILE